MPLSSFLLHLLITHFFFLLGVVFLILIILYLSIVLWVRDTFSMLLLLWVCRPKILLILFLKFFIDFNNVPISDSQWGYAQEMHLDLDPFCRPLWYFKTRFHWESLILSFVSKVWKMLVYSDTIFSLSQHKVSHIIYYSSLFNMVVFLLEGINKRCPNGFSP